MPNGRGGGCPDNKSRITEVHFTCGVADEISYVQEPSTCIYRFDFTTPAACWWKIVAGSSKLKSLQKLKPKSYTRPRFLYFGALNLNPKFKCVGYYPTKNLAKILA